MATETEKPTPESTGDPRARTRAEVKAKREEKREERRVARADKTAAKEAKASDRAAAKEARNADKAEAAAAKPAKPAKGEKKKRSFAMPSFKGGIDSVRTLVGQLVWIVAVVCALFLAVGALTQVIGPVDGQNQLVQFIRDGAETVSLGLFSREDGVFDFVGVNSSEYNALANYGLGAVLYLVVGRVLDRVIRP